MGDEQHLENGIWGILGICITGGHLWVPCIKKPRVTMLSCSVHIGRLFEYYGGSSVQVLVDLSVPWGCAFLWKANVEALWVLRGFVVCVNISNINYSESSSINSPFSRRNSNRGLLEDNFWFSFPFLTLVLHSSAADLKWKKMKMKIIIGETGLLLSSS